MGEWALGDLRGLDEGEGGVRQEAESVPERPVVGDDRRVRLVCRVVQKLPDLGCELRVRHGQLEDARPAPVAAA